MGGAETEDGVSLGVCICYEVLFYLLFKSGMVRPLPGHLEVPASRPTSPRRPPPFSFQSLVPSFTLPIVWYFIRYSLHLSPSPSFYCQSVDHTFNRFIFFFLSYCHSIVLSLLVSCGCISTIRQHTGEYKLPVTTPFYWRQDLPIGAFFWSFCRDQCCLSSDSFYRHEAGLLDTNTSTIFKRNFISSLFVR